jgi:hypothetical protein
LKVKSHQGKDDPGLKQPSFTVLLGLCLLVAFMFAPPAEAQSDDSRYFSETGHTVREPFLSFFNQTGGLTRYGYPITDDYVDPQTGLLVQYFQKARLEWRPGNPDPYKIQLGLLGDQLGKRTPPLPVSKIPSAADPNCHYFPETGHTACYKFLEYWRQNGGLDLYGYPIDEHIIENGRIVQYFQRAKMEWYPEKPEGQRMQLAHLGQIYYDFAQLDRNRLLAKPDSAGFGNVTSIRARASVLDAVVPGGSSQTAYIYVTNQLNKPLSGVAVTLIVHYPAGDKSFTLPPTDDKGATFFSFEVGKAVPGTIISMEFLVDYPGLSQVRERTSYMVWFY